MAVTDANIAIRVGGDVTTLQSEMQRGARSVRQFASKSAKQIRSTVNQLGKLGLAATAAGAAMTAAIYTRQSKVIDSLAKTADALGLTTERLQALNHTAELNGVSAEQMSKGLRRMETNLGQAARRGGSAAEAFEEIGLDIKNLLSLRPDQQIQVIADKLSAVDNQAIKASIATDLFGREGTKMLKVLTSLGREGVDPTVEKLGRLGIALSRVDAAKVEQANDAFFKAKQVTEGLANTLTVELAPYVEEVANQFLAAAEANGGFKNEMTSAINTGIRGFAKLADIIQGLRVVFKGVELVAKGFGSAVITVVEVAGRGLAAFIDGMIANVNRAIDALNMLPKVDIANVDPFSDSAFIQGLVEMGDKSRNEVGRVREELHNLAMQEMPSDKVEEFLASVAKKAEETATIIADTVAAPLQTSEGIQTNDEKSEDEKDEARLEKLKEKYLTEQELMAQHQEAMALIGSEWDASKFETEEQWRQVRMQAEQSFYRQLGDLTNKGYSGVQSVISNKWGAITAESAGAMKSIIGTMATGSRKAFEISKAWAMADALISTFQGIAAGVKLGWPMGIPAVAWAAATGFAQVTAIKNQKFGGAGGAAASGGGAPATAPNPANVGGQTQQGGDSQGGALVTVSGINPNDIFDGRTLISLINEAQQNGARIAAVV